MSNVLIRLKNKKMFIEPLTERYSTEKVKKGWIELVCGPMFSGKTEELIRRLNRALIAGQKVEIFKPAIDKRYDEKNVVSHNQTIIRSTAIDFANDMLLLAGDSDVVGVDEAQFFDSEIVKTTQVLANSGKRIIIAGLDLDYKAKPFGKMPELMAYAEYVTKLHAICVQCGALASFTYRISESGNQIMLGEKDIYESRCRECYNKGKHAKKTI